MSVGWRFPVSHRAAHCLGVLVLLLVIWLAAVPIPERPSSYLTSTFVVLGFPYYFVPSVCGSSSVWRCERLSAHILSYRTLYHPSVTVFGDWVDDLTLEVETFSRRSSRTSSSRNLIVITGTVPLIVTQFVLIFEYPFLYSFVASRFISLLLLLMTEVKYLLRWEKCLILSNWAGSI